MVKLLQCLLVLKSSMALFTYRDWGIDEHCDNCTVEDTPGSGSRTAHSAASLSLLTNVISILRVNNLSDLKNLKNAAMSTISCPKKHQLPQGRPELFGQ